MEGGPFYVNRYMYVWNDPVNYTDPTGMCVGPAIIPCGIVAKEGAIIAGAVIIAFFAADDAVEAATGTSDGTIIAIMQFLTCLRISRHLLSTL